MHSEEPPSSSQANTIVTYLERGKGRAPNKGDSVVLLYSAKGASGKVFTDHKRATEISEYVLGRRYAGYPGKFGEALLQLREGDHALIRIVAGFGERAPPQYGLKKNETVEYEVRIVGVKSRRLGQVVWDYYERGGFESARKIFYAAKETEFHEIAVVPGQLTYVAFGLLYQLNEIEEAIEVLRWNLALFPQSADVHDSLAEALFLAGDRLGAIEYYRKALKLDPNLKSAKKGLATLTADEASPTECQRLELCLNTVGRFSAPFSKISPNYSYLERKLDLVLALPSGASDVEKMRLKTAYLALANRYHPADMQRIIDKYGPPSSTD